MKPGSCALISPSTDHEWASYHRIRRTILFEKRGQFGPYDPDRPDDRKSSNFAKLLVCDSHHVGVVRIDLAGNVAYLRRVAIDEPWQRQGLGRVLISLSESFASEHGARRIESSVAEDAVGFYDKCGYRLLPGSAAHMWKDLR
jgi:GNAT superfamily N-acetyltransferase